ncbi:MAG: uridine diphosphate-N-acetylglucosamine-binding protein YvcK [Candidatus Omnitrophota bacterium]|nr:uridine diphosphate-N-acetylglucosamine-binding protein YvcK [Candidatus Omnitrophota bacterium]
MYKKFLLIGSENFVDEIKPALSELALEIEIAQDYQEIVSVLRKKSIDIVLFDADHYPLKSSSLQKIFKLLKQSKKEFVVFSGIKNISTVLKAGEIGSSDYILKPYNFRELSLRLTAILNHRKKIVCLGGGTGLFNLLMGLKNLPDVLPISVVSTTDDGGSSGKLRESFGVLPPGDVRRSLVALSTAPEAMNDIMTYRFTEGGCFVGHSLGNLLLTALTKIKGSMSLAVSGLSDILNIQGIVLPVAITKSKLCALFEDGTVIKGESNIDLGKGRPPDLRIKKCWHEPPPKCNPNSFASIINADIVIMGPGDLYTSVITNLLIGDIRQAVTGTKSKKFYICNIMTKPGETSDFTALDHIKEIVKYLKQDCLDYVIISDNSSLSKGALLRYSRKKQFPVQVGDISEIKRITNAKIIIADVAHETELIRHDNQKIADCLIKIIRQEHLK